MAEPSVPLAEIIVGRIIANYIDAAATALFVYDYLITFNAEVKHIWSSPWSFGRISFHFNRTLGVLIAFITSPVTFGYSFSLTTCRAITAIYGYGVIFLVLNISCIMILRAWILYDQKRSVLISLGLLCMGILTVCIIDFAIQLKYLQLLPNPAPELITGCLITIPMDLARIPYIAAFSLDTSIFILCIWRTWALSKSGSDSPLVNRLARDGTVYYLLNSVSFALAIVGVRLGISGYLLAFHSTLCTRMILSLRTFEPGGLLMTDIKTVIESSGFSLGISASALPAQNSSLIELGDATTFARGTSR